MPTDNAAQHERGRAERPDLLTEDRLAAQALDRLFGDYAKAFASSGT